MSGRETRSVAANPFLLPARYRVEAEMQGFKKYVREPVQVFTATRVGLNHGWVSI